MNKMFQYLIILKPLGMMYGSSGAFLSPENLIGRSGAKFPPEAATLSGLFFSINIKSKKYKPEVLKYELFTAGPFWAKIKDPQNIYVPLPRTKIIAKNNRDEWTIKKKDDDKDWQWQRDEKKDVEAEYEWFPIDDWEKKLKAINIKDAKLPWAFMPILHPKMEEEQRCAVEKDGLFLENAVQMREDTCLVYLSTHPLDPGWYKFGGENHLVEIESIEIEPDGKLDTLLQKPIQDAFALITRGVWGSSHLSRRHPLHPDFPEIKLMLTDKTIPYRYGVGGRLGRGRYAVPAGSVYVLEDSINKSWCAWPQDWFPKEGFYLKQVGCGLCLPLEIARSESHV